MRALYDVNMLIALFDPQHTQHIKARSWHATHGRVGWATCPLTQNGLLRIVSQPRYTNAATVAELLALLQPAVADPAHRFWPDDISLVTPGTLNTGRALTSGAITEVYLLALATHHKGRLVTLDTRISIEAVAPARSQNLVVL